MKTSFWILTLLVGLPAFLACDTATDSGPGEPEILLSGDWYSWAAPSPDGRYVVCIKVSLPPDLVLLDLEDHSVIQLTDSDQREINPSWSVNSQYIYFIAGVNLYRMLASDGDDSKELILENSSYYVFNSDETKIAHGYYTEDEIHELHLYDMTTGRDDVIPGTHGLKAYYFCFLPDNDNQLLVSARDESCTHEYLLDIESGELEPFGAEHPTMQVTRMSISPDNRYAYYSLYDHDIEKSILWKVSLDTGRHQEITAGGSGNWSFDEAVIGNDGYIYFGNAGWIVRFLL